MLYWPIIDFSRRLRMASATGSAPHARGRSRVIAHLPPRIREEVDIKYHAAAAVKSRADSIVGVDGYGFAIGLVDYLLVIISLADMLIKSAAR